MEIAQTAFVELDFAMISSIGGRTSSALAEKTSLDWFCFCVLRALYLSPAPNKTFVGLGPRHHLQHDVLSATFMCYENLQEDQYR